MALKDISTWVDEYYLHASSTPNSNLNMLMNLAMDVVHRDVDWDEWLMPSGRRRMDVDVQASYSHPDHPGALVEVIKMTADARDPRNPNPDAGRRSYWTIKANGRRSKKEFPALGAAKLRAKLLHDKIVAGLQDAEAKKLELRRSANPNYARF